MYDKDEFFEKKCFNCKYITYHTRHGYHYCAKYQKQIFEEESMSECSLQDNIKNLLKNS